MTTHLPMRSIPEPQPDGYYVLIPWPSNFPRLCECGVTFEVPYWSDRGVCDGCLVKGVRCADPA